MTLPGRMVYGQMNMLPWLQRFQGLLLADFCLSPPSVLGRSEPLSFDAQLVKSSAIGGQIQCKWLVSSNANVWSSALQFCNQLKAAAVKVNYLFDSRLHVSEPTGKRHSENKWFHHFRDAWVLYRYHDLAWHVGVVQSDATKGTMDKCVKRKWGRMQAHRGLHREQNCATKNYAAHSRQEGVDYHPQQGR